MQRGNTLSDLDSSQTYLRLDPSGMAGRIKDLPNQCRQVQEAVGRVQLPDRLRSMERVLIAGMGGSAIGGDLLADVASVESTIPVTVWRDYNLPPSVDDKTLVIACSYSGGTEETLSAFKEAMAKDAGVVAVTGGATLAQEAANANIPVVPIDYQGEPRAAIGYSFLAPLLVLAKLGLVAVPTNMVAEAVDELERHIPLLAAETPEVQNPAKQLARELLGRLPVVYGSGLLQGVARRWKTQLNENAKVWAFFELLPEANHNAVVGYQLPDAVRSLAFVVLLRPTDPHPRVALRYEVTQELLDQQGVPYRVVEARGASALSQIFSSLIVGDYVSYYLAILQGIDPSPVGPIAHVRQRLAG